MYCVRKPVREHNYVGATCEKGIQHTRWPHTLTRASHMNLAQSTVHLGCRNEGQSDLWVGRNQSGPIERRANMPHNDFGTSHFPFTHYGHLKIKRTPVSPRGSKCEHLWQESVRPDFYSQWQQGAVWPAAELKIVPSGLARHTRTKKNPLCSNKLINSEHTRQTQQSH